MSQGWFFARCDVFWAGHLGLLGFKPLAGTKSEKPDRVIIVGQLSRLPPKIF